MADTEPRGVPDPPPPDMPRHGRLALSAAFFSFATGLSRIAGLVREVVAAGYYGVSPQMSAFTIAFNVPNLVRSLFADAALQAAFVPVFSDLLQRGDRREAFRVASTLFYMIALVLGAVTALFILLAPWVIPLFISGDQVPEGLTIGLSRVLFPIVVLLGLTGLFVGMLNSLDHFGLPAIAPLFWNLAIIAAIVGLAPLMPEGDAIYAYAIGVLVGTAIQMAMPLPLLRGRGGGERLGRYFKPRDPNVLRVLVLMLPVTIGLGLINFNLTINNFFGSAVGGDAPAAIDKAFRVYMLPQGMFSVAIATILFPTMSRLAARGDHDGLRETMGVGVRQIVFLLLPAAVATAVLADPIVRLLFERGEFDAADTTLVSTALFWFSFSLPFSGANLLYTRTFFALQRPWLPTALAAGNLAINAGLALALYRPFGVAGIVAATVVATAAMAVAQALWLRRAIGGIDGARLLASSIRVICAAAALAVASYAIWRAFDTALGRGLAAQVVTMGAALTAGGLAYVSAAFALRAPEATQLAALVRGRLRRRDP